MACVGRTKQCTLVPPNHFGPIPGVEVGSQWKFRVQVITVGVFVYVSNFGPISAIVVASQSYFSIPVQLDSTRSV